MKGIFFAILGATFSGAVAAESIATLQTPSFTVRIEVRCAEGNVTCDDVIYTGTSRKTKKSVSLRGRTMHAKCADGVTPCRFQGYIFNRGQASYTVLEEGELIVVQGEKTLVREPGKWD